MFFAAKAEEKRIRREKSGERLRESYRDLVSPYELPEIIEFLIARREQSPSEAFSQSTRENYVVVATYHKIF